MFKSVDYTKADGTRYFGFTLQATQQELTKVFGKPFTHKDGKGKYVWTVESDLGPVVTIYDWKHGNFAENQTIDWNVGMAEKDEGLLVDLEAYIHITLNP